MRRIVLAVLFIAFSLYLNGCGRPVMPGSQLTGERPDISTAIDTSSAEPTIPFWEQGSSEARIRILAFYPVDPEHELLQDLLKSLVKQYPGKLYVKYVDPRTPKGMQILERAKGMDFSLTINDEEMVEVKAKPTPYVVNFGGEMGRHWTADHLKAVIAQEVARAYGGKD